MKLKKVINVDFFKFPAWLNGLISFNNTKDFIRGTTRSSFFRNVAVVATGTAGAQAIRIAFSPVITRIYDPEVFGFLGAFVSITNVLIPLAALSYPIAIVLPRKDSDAGSVARLSAFTALVISLFAAVTLLTARGALVELLNLQAVSRFLLLIPFVMFTSALMQIAEQWLIRKKQFSVTAKATVFTAFIVKSAQAGIGWLNPVASVLIILAASANAIHAVMLGIGIKRSRIARGLYKQARKSRPSFKYTAKKHYDFPLFRTPQAFINAVSQSLPVLLLAGFFNPAAAGFYTLGKTVMGIPAMLISNSVSTVFYPHITEAAQGGQNPTRLIAKATAMLGAAGFIPFAAVSAFGPAMFSFIFGAEWTVAGEYARWMALWFFFGFLNTPSIAAIPVLSLQGFFLGFEFAGIIVRTLAIATGFYIFESSLAAVAMFSLAGVFLNMFLIGVILVKSKNFTTLAGE